MKSLLAMPHLASRLFGTPLAIEPGKLSIILSAIGERVTGMELEGLLPAKSAAKQERAESITTMVDGVAVLDVTGTLVHRSSWMDAMSGLASYENLSAEFDKAATDPNVKAILLCLNSPGGEVSGMFEMAERIRSARKQGRPIYAIAADTACSAAYMLGAACDKFYATEAAVTGSIGVVVAHMDVSEADKKAGIKITHVHAGDRKVDGNPHEPLSDEAKGTLQALVDSTAAVFFARVAAYRGTSPAAIQATQAAVYVGADAVKAGIIDGIKSTRAVLAELKSGQGSMAFASATTSSGAYASGGGGGGTITWSRINWANTDGTFSKTISAPLAAEARADLLRQLRAELEEQAPAEPAPEKCPECGMSEEDCTCEEAPEAIAAPETTSPDEGAITEEAEMAGVENKGPSAEVVALQAQLAKVMADNAEKDAAIAKANGAVKAEVIEKHIRRGVAPAMRATAEKLAETLDAEALESVLASWPSSSRPVATGTTDAAPAPESILTGNALTDLSKVAAEVQKQHPAWTKEKAYAEALRIRPDLYLNQRGSIAGNAISGKA